MSAFASTARLCTSVHREVPLLYSSFNNKTCIRPHTLRRIIITRVYGTIGLMGLQFGVNQKVCMHRRRSKNAVSGLLYRPITF